MADTKDYTSMSEADLGKELVELRREQFNLRMQHGTGNTPKIHLFKAVRKNIARVKTALTATKAGNK